jgi:hypothetical protein
MVDKKSFTPWPPVTEDGWRRAYKFRDRLMAEVDSVEDADGEMQRPRGPAGEVVEDYSTLRASTAVASRAAMLS